VETVHSAGTRRLVVLGVLALPVGPSQASADPGGEAATEGTVATVVVEAAVPLSESSNKSGQRGPGYRITPLPSVLAALEETRQLQPRLVHKDS
jgi:hypothetical protein